MSQSRFGRARPTRRAAVKSGSAFATWILLALEFALAADLVRTAVAPTWDDISKLAVIATIRTMLNYFLAKDIASFDKATGVKSRAK
ncbi:MAG TPA: DUF1622 domain-containing protein [Methyloceanibacter sp.]